MMKIKKIAVSALALSLLFSNGVCAKEENNSAKSVGTIYNTADVNSGDDKTDTSSEGKDSDISIHGVSNPSGVYGMQVKISFTADGNDGARIKKIYPIVDSDFPFECDDQAYKEVKCTQPVGDAGLACEYMFTVRQDVTTGYKPVKFAIEYVKGDSTYSVVKTINTQLTGKPEEAEKTDDKKISTPRIIVTGYEIDKDKVFAGEEFMLTIHVQNTSKQTSVNNIKFNLTTTDGEFLPTSGSSTIYVASIPCGGTADLEVEMKSKASLEQKPYVLSLAEVYEDGECNPFEATESISIPVYQECKISVTDIVASPDYIGVGDQTNIMFSINNQGNGPLNNVRVTFKDESVYADESYVGNILAGTTGYADAMVSAVEVDDDGIITAIITYEDADGEEFTYEQDINVFIDEMVYDETMNEEVYEEEIEGPNVLGIIIKLLIVEVIFVAIVVVVIVIIAKKKKKKQEEEIDDEIS